ncbi:unnamed protein product [Symbiodinium natans]|uniref:EamA domain-containing protein n=1 Tax=Symbiodinium natans TaxID=878477 RepID=A0A812IA09_9DINO|nr:unnamed protein product [Symbiodinium natans]
MMDAVYLGKPYASDTHGNVVALDTQHGEVVWKAQFTKANGQDNENGTGRLLAFAAFLLLLAVCALVAELRKPLDKRGWVVVASLASVFFGFDNFFVAHAGNLFKPIEYMSAMLLMVGVLSALGSLLLATFCESFRSEAKRCAEQASTLKLVWFLCSGAFIALAQTCGCLSFSLDEANSGPNQSVVVANVPLVGFFFYMYSRETLSRQQIMGCFLIMAGVIYMSGLLSHPADDQSVLQDRSFLWICVSCGFYAASIITIRLAGEADLPSRPKTVSIVFLSGLLGFILLRLLLSDGSYICVLSPATLVWPLFNALASMLGLFSVVVSYEVPDSKAALATAIIDSNSVPMCILNFILLGKVPNMSKLIGMIMVLLGCSLASLKSEANEMYKVLPSYPVETAT